MALNVRSFRNAAVKATAVNVTAQTTAYDGSAQLFALHITNLDAAVGWLHLYDAADQSTVTVGTTVPKWSISLKASDTLTVATNPVSSDIGFLSFTHGIVVAATTTVGGSTPGTSGLAVNLSYI